MIPELCVVKYHSVTKSYSDCIIKSRCKIRHCIGTSSSDEARITIKEKPLGSLLVWRKPSGQILKIFECERAVYVGIAGTRLAIAKRVSPQI